MIVWLSVEIQDVVIYSILDGHRNVWGVSGLEMLSQLNVTFSVNDLEILLRRGQESTFLAPGFLYFQGNFGRLKKKSYFGRKNFKHKIKTWNTTLSTHVLTALCYQNAKYGSLYEIRFRLKSQIRQATRHCYYWLYMRNLLQVL